MTSFYIYVRNYITSYYILKYNIILFIIFKRHSFSMLQQINQNLKQIVPYYTQASQYTSKTYENTTQSITDLTQRIQDKVAQSRKNLLTFKQGLQNEILILVEQASNQFLTRTEKLLLSSEQRPSQSEKKQIKKRFQRVYNKIITDYVRFYAEQAKKYNMALVKQGRQYVYTYVLPMYIKLKATVLVSKQILMQILESRIDNMKMTYTVSKDTVTMLIRGKFEEDKIIQKISSGMQNFKQLTVKVVRKGLQIKVDKKSLYDNYQTFSLKLLELIRQMRQKGAQKIVSVKQKTAQLYQNVISRIREKQISLKMEYKQLKDKEETQLSTRKNRQETQPLTQQQTD